ncbi:hypothetical protein DEQ92_18090 [Haloferax sp. Atlit-6N]|nr:hypothetical protein DEQ92_18090 [Haloferax sp. Atlit-6N]
MSSKVHVIDQQIEPFDTLSISKSATPNYDRENGRIRVAYPADTDDQQEYVFSVYRYGDANTFEVADGAKVLDYGEGVAYVLTPANAYGGDD